MAQVKRRRESAGRTLPQMVTTILSGGLLAFGTALVLLLAAAWLMSSGKLGEGLTTQVCIGAAALGGLVGGFYTARTLRWRVLPAALGAALTGALLWVLAGAAGFGTVSAAGVGRLLAASLAGGGIAGILAAR